MKLRITDQANADLARIWDFIADDSVRAADKMLDRLEKAFWMLVDFLRLEWRVPN